MAGPGIKPGTSFIHRTDSVICRHSIEAKTCLTAGLQIYGTSNFPVMFTMILQTVKELKTEIRKTGH